MTPNILITGATGYIGGSVLADLLANPNSLVRKECISAVVRSAEQVEKLSSLGIRLLRADLTDEKAVLDAVLEHKIDIIVHIAGSIELEKAAYLIRALGKRREITGEKTYLIHTAGTTAYSPSTGWRHGEVKDTDSVLDLEKQTQDQYPLRQTNILVTELAKECGVDSFIIAPSSVYGRGTGPWSGLSTQIPGCIRASRLLRRVYKFPEDMRIPAVHISDLVLVYRLLLEKIVRAEHPPSGENGYYFIVAHEMNWWEILNHLGTALYSRGDVDDPTPQTWPSDEMAAKAFGVPPEFLHPIWNSSSKPIAKRAYSLGWKPQWTNEIFLRNIDDEIQAVNDLSGFRSSTLGSLKDVNYKN